MTSESLVTLCVWDTEEILRKVNDGAYLLLGLMDKVETQRDCIDIDYLLAILHIADDIILEIGDKAMEHRANLKHLKADIDNGAE